MSPGWEQAILKTGCWNSFKALLQMLTLTLVLSVSVGIAVASTAPVSPDSGMMFAKISGLSVPVLLPRQAQENGDQAIQHYNSAVAQTSLSELWIKSPANGRLEVSAENATFQSRKKYALIVANKTSDMQAASIRIENVARLLRQNGFQPVMLALGAGSSLEEKPLDEFYKKISGQFELLMALGGDDVDPSLYGQKKTFARYTHALRDGLEFKLIKTFKQQGRGMFVGICRGHQLGAVVDGHTLYQDLVQEKVVATDHHEASRHPLLMGSELQSIVGIRRTSLTVNSIHHQAVKVNPEANSRPIGYSMDGVVEALEMKNGKGISFQFHPEIMASAESTSLLDRYIGNKFFAAIEKRMDKIRATRLFCPTVHL